VLVETVGNVPIMHVQQIRLTTGKAVLKRTLDLIVGISLGLVTLPLWIPAWLAIQVDTKGPVLFQQRRVGKDGNYFTCLKFRTMHPDAEERLADLREHNQVGDPNDIFFKIEDDPRVTPVGRFLRKWSIDELPQLWNVLRGDMSMVGPRPLPVNAEQFEPWQLRRLRVRPGITGVWQVSGRSYVETDDAVRMDIFYIENWSLGWDLLILLQTIAAVLRNEGAH
jgi:lipopolysaccharide/colanic/teichoic acid biosynthesis glycosyltransferase